MTFASFRKRVFALARSEGTPFLRPAIDVEEFNDLVQEGMDEWAVGAQCLQADNITFTPIAGYSSFDTGQTSIVVAGITTTYLSERLCAVRQVVIDGAYLQMYTDDLGRPGPSSEYDMQMGNQGYLTASSGKPGYWWIEPPNTLRFDRAFDQSYSNCFLSGRRYHPLYAANDTDDISFAPEDIEGAATICAAKLLWPNSKEKAAALRAWAESKMKQRKAECGIKHSNAAQRGSPEHFDRTVNMVYGGIGGGISPRRFRGG